MTAAADRGAERLHMNITMREYYAGQALAGILANGRNVTREEVARQAWEHAEAMLAPEPTKPTDAGQAALRG